MSDDGRAPQEAARSDAALPWRRTGLVVGVDGSPGSVAALRAARDLAQKLVVGRRGFAGLLLGSVSAACAAHAACPVLVAPRPVAP
jgi:nucleotide-binding universal stress UspA family protein